MKTNDAAMNSHFPPALQNWRANQDLNVITDLWDVIRYVAKYITKKEMRSSSFLSLLNATKEDNKYDAAIHSIFQWACQFAFSNRDIGASEAARYLLGIPLWHSNVKIQKA